MNHHQAALLLDNLLCSDFATLQHLAEQAAASPLADQISAAARHVRQSICDGARDHGFAYLERPACDVPEWVRLGLLDAFAAWVGGHADTCQHQPTYRRPQPVVAAAWRPGVIACGQCTHLFLLPRHRDNDRRCDGCGRITTGPENSDGIRPNVAALAGFAYMFGTCAECSDRVMSRLHFGPEDSCAE